MLIYLLTFVHVIVCFVLILVVLLQQGKGADIAGAFGGGGSQTVFGARGASTFLSKATTAAAVIFMLTSLTLTLLISRPGGNTVLSDSAAPAETTPAAPAKAEPAKPDDSAAPVVPPTPSEPEKK
jgi:preprotein translocase subunit SecG